MNPRCTSNGAASGIAAASGARQQLVFERQDRNGARRPGRAAIQRVVEQTLSELPAVSAALKRRRNDRASIAVVIVLHHGQAA
jgi:hypothetical protein